MCEREPLDPDTFRALFAFQRDKIMRIVNHFQSDDHHFAPTNTITLAATRSAFDGSYCNQLKSYGRSQKHESSLGIETVQQFALRFLGEFVPKSMNPLWGLKQ